MPELNFAIESAAPLDRAEGPVIGFRLCVVESSREPTPICSVGLRAQVRIQPARRRYSETERDNLLHLFGTPDRWGRTVRDLLWANVGVAVPPFVGETRVELRVPCPHDPAQAACRYFEALGGGTVPLSFAFSGTVFYEAAGIGTQVGMIPWDREARYALPVAVWRDLFAEATR